MKIDEPLWLSEKAIRAIYEALISRTGGTFGILNEGMLESTLNKPKNTYCYENNPSIFKLAVFSLIDLVFLKINLFNAFI